jgi:AcrR family transcriptional regulator
VSDIGTPSTSSPGLRALPIVTTAPGFPPARERTDAARNRARILEAAQRLFAQHGPDGVSMDAVAKAASVGKGTLYRRFGDRESLLLAVFSEREAAFQDELLHGPAPLGPGGTPAERLHAFAPAYLALLEEVGPIVAAVEDGLPGTRYRNGPYASYILHLRLLLEQGNPHGDAEWGAEALLALVRASHLMHLRRQGIDLDRIARGWCVMVDALLRAGRPA